MAKSVNDSVHWYMSELTSRIVAESGIPGDRFHLGKIMMQCMKDDPDLVLQTDGATDESETSGSILFRSVRCANSLRALGLQTGDVMVLMAPNHIDLAIPFYAALFNGIIIAVVDRNLGLTELQSTFSADRPKIIFCQSEKVSDIQITLNELELPAHIVIFDRGDCNLLNFSDFMDQYDDGTTVEDFKCENFDTEESVAILIATSGTTGLPKAVALTHKNVAITNPYHWSRYRTFPGPTQLCLVASPLQWQTAIVSYVSSTILRYPRLVTSKPLTPHHAYDLINKYKPSFAIFSPPVMTRLLMPGDRDACDFTCFELIFVGGSAVTGDLIDEIRTVTPNTEVMIGYGLSELSNIAFNSDNAPRESNGKPIGCLQYRLIDNKTMQDIEEPNTPGELWLKGPGIFKEYYNNPEATEEAFAEDRWFKTGDMFYRDENYNYFFVERIKLLLKYMSNKISPVQLEAVIRQHPGVLDVAVTSVPDPARGDLPVACVVPAPGTPPTAQEIKDLVRDTLPDAKQLRGGVIFLPDLPLTETTKVHRRKLREMALTLERE